MPSNNRQPVSRDARPDQAAYLADLPRTARLADTVKGVFGALIIAIVANTLIFKPYFIPSGSMIPSLEIGDYLFVTKYPYGYSRYSLPFDANLFSGRIFAGQPKRGDVVVFKSPADQQTNVIKRLIGLPGDTIELRAENLVINGKLADLKAVPGGRHFDPQLQSVVETYTETLPNGFSHRIQQALDRPLNQNFPQCPDRQERCVYTVPARFYFVLGDNRDNSLDSRVPASMGGVGALPDANLIGRAELIFFSSDGSAARWQPWTWISSIRFSRLFERVS
jgi:signal peptidase I